MGIYFLSKSQVNINFILKTPLPSDIAEWQNDPTVAQLIITNTTTNSYQNAYFIIKIINEKGAVIALVNKNSKFLPKINIPAGPTTLTLNGPQIFNINSVDFDKRIQKISLYTNSIPEGEYQVCISVFDQYGNNITNGEEYCTRIFITIPEPPVLLSPVNDELISSLFPNFSWLPLTSIQPGTVVKYKLKICPVFQGQTPRTALESNSPLLEKNDLINTSYQYLPTDLPFNYYPSVNQFVWMVQAFNQNNIPIGKNQGKSEIGTFRIAPQSTEISISNIYPLNNDTIPWNPPHLIIQFSPYSNDIIAINYTLKVKNQENSITYTHNKTLNFPTGPQTSQGLNVPDKANFIITNIDELKTFPEWMKNLEPGIKYTWHVEATIRKADGTTSTSRSNETSFVIGFKKPVNIYPSLDTFIKSNTNFNISFKIPNPSQLNFNNVEVLDQSLFHAYNTYSNALKKFSIEFSKKSSFDSIYKTITFEIPNDFDYKTGNNCIGLFNTIKKQINIDDTSKYYWRINYLKQDGSSYYTGNIKQIKIVPDTTYTCFEMKSEVPVNGGRWTTNKNPRFSVSIKPEIRKEAITGGCIKIWKMNSQTQDTSEIKRNKPIIDTCFTGNDNKKLYAYSTDVFGYTRYDINFINYDSSSVTFNAGNDTSYLWNFTLKYKNDSIRLDGIPCRKSELKSNDAIFLVSTSGSSDSSDCYDDCYSPLPSNRTPATITFASDTVIKIGKFNLKLKNVTGTGNSLSGDGEIDVPYLRAPILVEFNGIKVNNNMEVYEGEVYAKIDANAPYTKSEGNDFEGKVLSFAEDKLKFQKIHEYSNSSGKLVSALIGSTAVSLPIGFDHNYDGYNTVYSIIGMKFTPSQAVFNAAMYVELPSLGPNVGFGLGAKNICFHKDGFGKNGILYLAQDFGYRNEDFWSFLFKAPTPSDSGTFARWDCHGFKEFVISAEVEFPRSWFTPLNESDPTKLVKAYFKTRADKNGNGWQWIANANLDECEITSLEGFKLLVQEMTFDYSDIQNPNSISFPSNYTGTKNNEWKGFYIKRATITLPDNLRTFDEHNPTLSINNLIIDKTGFTADINAENVIQYPFGNFGNWGGSIDTIRVKLVSSSLQTGQIKGRLKISIADSSLLYTGTLSRSSDNGKLKYLFSIIPVDTISADIWKCKLSLLPTSKIELSNESGSFVAQATLNGTFTLTGDIGEISKLGFKGIQFENLKISSVSPYFDKGNWSFASPQHSMAGFPVSINNLDIITGSRGGSYGVGIQFTLAVNMQPEPNTISGSTTLNIWGKLTTGSGPQHFVFDEIELNEVNINANLGFINIAGNVRLYNSDQVYGNGFRGSLTATFIEQLTVSATAQFGSVNNYRYWYVDAKAIFSTGIPVYSGLAIYGFGGGAWYHMSKTGSTNLNSTSSSADESSTPGNTNSGYSYRPDKNVDFGFSGLIALGTHPSSEAFNGDVSISASFLNSGGIEMISLNGNGYMLCNINDRRNAKITANVDIEYNFPTKTYHGVFEVDINASPFTGNGQMVMHFSPELWYIKIGEPSERININLASWLSVNGYFMTGQSLPPPPPLPSEVSGLFNLSEIRNPAIENGNGFAFGANAEFNTGKLTYLIFYGQIKALIGFDFALLNLPGAHCEDISGPIGINGWYATGQIYAYLKAEIGIHVDLWFTEGDFKILGLEVGTALLGGGPNPTWVKGAVEGRYEILGGAVKGHCIFEFEKGDGCRPIFESPLANIDLISDIDPVDGSRNVDVAIEPQIALNFQHELPFELQEMSINPDEPGRIRTFRIKIADFKLINSVTGDSVLGRKNFSSDKFNVYYTPHDLLNGHTSYRFITSVYGEEFISNSWQVARKNNGGIIKQTVESRFTTGPLPDKIRPTDVAYSYPINGQRYFLQNECRNGRVQLKVGYPHLFGPKDGYIVSLYARFIPIDYNLEPIEEPLTYNSASGTIYFNIPQLINNKGYFVQIIRKEYKIQTFTPQYQMQASQQGESQTTTKTPFRSFSTDDINTTTSNIHERLVLNKSFTTLYLSRRTISATRVRAGEKLLYAFYFRTSNYNTLQSKLNSFVYVETENINAIGNFQAPRAKYQGTENFDYYDFNPIRWFRGGTYNTYGPLIKTIASERTSTWHINFTNPQIYDEIQWMRAKGIWSGNVQFERYLSSSTLNFVEIDFNTYTPSLYEMANMIYSESTSPSSPAGSSSSAATGAGMTFSPAALTGSVNINNLTSPMQSVQVPYLKIHYNHGIIVPFDFNKIKENASRVLSSHWADLILSNSDKIRLNTILNRNYQLMPRGQYPLKFYYNDWGCRGPDDPLQTFSKPFIY